MTAVSKNPPVHPVADLFPMLGKEEADELVASITSEGLLNPIVLDSAGRVIDGRNRSVACQRAKVEPRYITYDGDADLYALTVNIARRHMSKGSLAMVAARASKLSPRGTVRDLADRVGVGKSPMARALFVIDYGGKQTVRAQSSPGASFNEAYAKAKN